VNRERMKVLRQLMVTLSKSKAKPVVGFNMADFVETALPDQSDHHCQTTACMAGWTVMAFGRKSEKELLNMSNDVIFGKAKKLLDLNTDQALHLFIPCDQDMHNMTPADAVKLIDAVMDET